MKHHADNNERHSESNTGKMDADSTRQSHTAPEQGVREQVNQGIRGPTVFNRVIDFDRTLRVRGGRIIFWQAINRRILFIFLLPGTKRWPKRSSGPSSIADLPALEPLRTKKSGVLNSLVLSRSSVPEKAPWDVTPHRSFWEARPQFCDSSQAIGTSRSPCQRGRQRQAGRSILRRLGCGR